MYGEKEECAGVKTLRGKIHRCIIFIYDGFLLPRLLREDEKNAIMPCKMTHLITKKRKFHQNDFYSILFFIHYLLAASIILAYLSAVSSLVKMSNAAYSSAYRSCKCKLQPCIAWIKRDRPVERSKRRCKIH